MSNENGSNENASMSTTDVCILGGGLAGLTLARQLRRNHSELAVTVVERSKFPVPKAVHKVGESTVELGSHYLSHDLGLKDHLAKAQLPKYGLRLFFGEYGDDLANADELGVSRVLKVPTYQIDRGILENHLAEELRAEGVTVYDGSQVRSVSLDRENHEVSIGSERLRCRWLIDAASRTSPLKQALKLAEPNDHDCNAAWFRVDRKIEVDQWSSDARWHGRVEDPRRWLSTNHLMGPGYWVWIIPLSSGATSIGIVADPRFVALDEINSHARSMAWLARHQPQCAQALEGAPVLDFRFLRNYSHSCSRLFSSERWALTGESGVFVDPFYSPGTDFIAIGNGYICDLIAREMRGERIRSRAPVYETLYRSFYQSTLQLYQGQYPGFGDRDLMILKTIWDYCYYWAVLGLLYFSRAMFNMQLMTRIGPTLQELQAQNTCIQDHFRKVSAKARRHPAEGRFVDQAKLPCLVRLNAELCEPLDDDAFVGRLRSNGEFLVQLADVLSGLTENAGQLPLTAFETENLGDLRQRLWG